jgi:hypothetical protein
MAPSVIYEGVAVRIREQAGCPVDDLLVQESERRHYHQLKDDQEITWGAEGGKLRKEFIDQRKECEARQEDFTLTVVVSHGHRKESLDRHTPKELQGVVAVRHFPAVQRPSDLARRDELRESLRRISASHSPGDELLRGIAEGFHLAWVERELDADRVADLGRMVAWLRERPAFRVHRPLPVQIHPEWERFLAILRGIPDLEWRFERGYFEWSLPPREAGFVEPPCDSEGFRRFVDRVLEVSPTTFEALEGLLP